MKKKKKKKIIIIISMSTFIFKIYFGKKYLIFYIFFFI